MPLFFLLALFLAFAKAEVSVNGTVSVQTPWGRYQAGDQLVYDFYLEIVISNGDSAHNVNLTFSSDFMQFSLDPIGSQFTWEYHDASTPATAETRATMTPTTEFTEGVISERLWLILTGPINSAGTSFVQGSFQMNVSDTVMPSDKMSSMMTVTYEDQPSAGSSFTSTYDSDFSYVENPVFEMDSPSFDPNRGIEIGIGDSVNVSVTAAFPKATVAPLIEVAGPFNQSAMMTFTDSLRTSFGANIPCSGCLTENQLESTAANLEYDRINAEVSDLVVSKGDVADPNNEMKLYFNIRLDDHVAVQNDTQEWIMAGIMYGRTHIWVGQIAVRAFVEEAERLPNLEALAELTSHSPGQDIYEGDDVTVSVSIWHCGQRIEDSCNGSPSRAVAFDVSIVLILPPFSTYKGIIFWDNLDSQPTVVPIQDTLIQLQLGDLSFSYEPVVKFNITVDPAGVTSSLNGSTFVGLVEVVYFTRQGAVINNNFTVVNFDYVKTTPAPTVTAGSRIKSYTCTCPFDIGRTDCACCVSGTSRCDNDYHEICVDNEDILSKCPSTDFHDAGYVVKGSEPAVYVCDSGDEALDKENEICTKGGLDGHWSGMKRQTINVLGVNTLTGALYGMHKNMRSYLMSEDGGLTWLTIQQQIYDDAKVDVNFVPVERAANNGSQSNGGQTVYGSMTDISYSGQTELVWTCPTCPL